MLTSPPSGLINKLADSPNPLPEALDTLSQTINRAGDIGVKARALRNRVVAGSDDLPSATAENAAVSADYGPGLIGSIRRHSDRLVAYLNEVEAAIDELRSLL